MMPAGIGKRPNGRKNISDGRRLANKPLRASRLMEMLWVGAPQLDANPLRGIVDADAL